ncbi:MAG: hypothetical protein IPH38_20730 [Candidatus Microthrix sp.]|nr:hypothetical protein [Candidatus Microthrix sp.]MBK7021930.1 hypothetical protein [Candidatus Microthrix sp.]
MAKAFLIVDVQRAPGEQSVVMPNTASSVANARPGIDGVASNGNRHW